MKRAIGILVAMVLSLGSIGVANAAPITVTWNGTSDGDFPGVFGPTTEITFAGFQANTLTSITGPGYAHNHGNRNTVFTIDLNINGTWTTIDSYSLPDNFTAHLLSERTAGGPINFSGGTITGIRLTDAPAVGFGYHNLNLPDNPTSFNFDATASAVPEPTTMAMLGMAAFTAAGHFGWRRRKQGVAA